MRPVERPTAPDGTDGVFNPPKKAQPHLVKSLGLYCSYCGIVRGAQIVVEHVFCKDDYQPRTTQWTNFLLSCSWCNGNKSKAEAAARKLGPKLMSDHAYATEFLWPHRDNTMRAFVSDVTGCVRIASGLPPAVDAAARSTFEMVGLGKLDDERWIQRRWIYKLAGREKERLAAGKIDREGVKQLALAHGFWEVWTTVFADDEPMLELLTNAFPGTWPDWNNPAVQPRPGGLL